MPSALHGSEMVVNSSNALKIGARSLAEASTCASCAIRSRSVLYSVIARRSASSRELFFSLFARSDVAGDSLDADWLAVFKDELCIYLYWDDCAIFRQD